MTTQTRRERLRAQTISEIKSAALTQIAAAGAATLSIRGVARAIGMSPAGLYRYYEGRDALLTDLITDAYNSLADAVEDAISEADGASIDRFLDGVRAYRGWAIEQPNRFLLIFGTPIPGYVAPEGGPTVDANRRMGQAFFRVAAEAWASGELRRDHTFRPPTAGEEELAAEIGQMVPGFPSDIVPGLIGAWAAWHGLISLEIMNQLDWLYDDMDVFIEGEFERIAHQVGLRT